MDDDVRTVWASLVDRTAKIVVMFQLGCRAHPLTKADSNLIAKAEKARKALDEYYDLLYRKMEADGPANKRPVLRGSQLYQGQG